MVQHHNKSNNRKWKMFHGPNGQPKVKSRAVAMRVQYGEGIVKPSTGGGARLPPPPRARPPAAAAAAAAASAATSSQRGRAAGRAARDSFSSDEEEEEEEQWENYSHLLGSRSGAPGAATSKAGAAARVPARDHQHGATYGAAGGLDAPPPVARAATGASAPPSWLKGFLAGH